MSLDIVVLIVVNSDVIFVNSKVCVMSMLGEVEGANWKNVLEFLY